MTAEEQSTLRIFQTRVRQMILQYNDKERLIAEKEGHIVELSRAMESRDKELQELKLENEKLREDYANLKMAKMIDISDAELGGAKARLSKLVREIDKCIALLNV